MAFDQIALARLKERLGRLEDMVRGLQGAPLGGGGFLPGSSIVEDSTPQIDAETGTAGTAVQARRSDGKDGLKLVGNPGDYEEAVGGNFVPTMEFVKDNADPVVRRGARVRLASITTSPDPCYTYQALAAVAVAGAVTKSGVALQLASDGCFYDSGSGLDLNLGTGLAIAANALGLSHLGLEALTDPGADRIFFWDESAGAGGASAWLTAGGGIEISGTTLQMATGASGHKLLGSQHSDVVAADPVAGDLILGNSTPKWDKLAVGAAYSILQVTAGVPAWTKTPTGLTSLSATTLYCDYLAEKTGSAGITVNHTLKGASTSVYIGSSASRFGYFYGTNMDMAREALSPGYYGTCWSDTATSCMLVYSIRRGGTQAAPSKILSGWDLLQLTMAGDYNGSHLRYDACRIRFRATEDWSATACGTEMLFYTSTTGSSTGGTARARMDGGGFGLYNGHNFLSITAGGSGIGTATYYFGAGYIDHLRVAQLSERVGSAGITVNHVLKLADGAVGAPGLCWSADTNTGPYRIGADNVGFAAGGALIFDYGATGITLAGALKAMFRDANNYIYSSASARLDINGQTTTGLRIGGNTIGEWSASGLTLADGKDVLGAVAGTSDLGSSGTGWGDIYLDTDKAIYFRASGQYIKSTNANYLDIGATTAIRIRRDMLPEADDEHALGSAAKRWKTFRAITATLETLSGTIAVNATLNFTDNGGKLRLPNYGDMDTAWPAMSAGEIGWARPVVEEVPGSWTLLVCDPAGAKYSVSIVAVGDPWA